jgi:NADP-dependent 3-hydroxy acid dehydrogenase YdfG
MARNGERLDKLKQELKDIQTRVADVTDSLVASQVLEELRPDILILNAGAIPSMIPVHEQS